MQFLISNMCKTWDRIRMRIDTGIVLMPIRIRIGIKRCCHIGRNLVLTTNMIVVYGVQVVSMMMGESGMPGVFFSYELAPVMVSETPLSAGFSRFKEPTSALSANFVDNNPDRGPNPIGSEISKQCCGSVIFWYGSGSADPCL